MYVCIILKRNILQSNLHSFSYLFIYFIIVQMKDPVFLPTSEKYMDRATITQHLLNDPKDPFNRKDLTIDMVQPAPQLKERMNRWLEEKRQASTK